MSNAMRRGGIPGPESRTGLTRPSMTEAEFERRIGTQAAATETSASLMIGSDPTTALEIESTPRSTSAVSSRPRVAAVKQAKPRRVQRMFAIEEDLDKKLWLYAIHLGKDRSEVVNDLLRPIVASMVLYDSRDRRGGAKRRAGLDRAATARRRAAELMAAEVLDRHDSWQTGESTDGTSKSDFNSQLHQETTSAGSRVLCLIDPSLECGKAERFEHILPAAQPRILEL